MATPRDYNDFLLSVYFGEKSSIDPKGACVDRAYLDFSRTIHGIAGKGRGVRAEAVSQIKSAISDLSYGRISKQDEFDDWHRNTCMSLKRLYECGVHKRGGFRFHIGQAQKWINMTMKYIYTFGEDRIPGFCSVYAFCHVPLDNRIVSRLTRYGFPQLAQPWSRIDDYRTYLNYQLWIRERSIPPPLDLELLVWMNRPIAGEMRYAEQP